MHKQIFAGFQIQNINDADMMDVPKRGKQGKGNQCKNIIRTLTNVKFNEQETKPVPK